MKLVKEYITKVLCKENVPAHCWTGTPDGQYMRNCLKKGLSRSKEWGTPRCRYGRTQPIEVYSDS